jgi:hypothetical protein
VNGIWTWCGYEMGRFGDSWVLVSTFALGRGCIFDPCYLLNTVLSDCNCHVWE